jgi:general secretion pathway protein D
MGRNRFSFILYFSSFIIFLIFLSSFIHHPSSFRIAPAFAEIKDQKVTFNFVDVDLQVVTKFISEITGKNFIFDERLRGKVTIIAPSKLPIDDAYNLFTSVLELKGFAVIPSGVDAYKIIPAIEARQRGIPVVTGRLPVNESYIARLIPLSHTPVDDALRFLQPVVSRDGHISSFGPGNLLLVIDSGLNVEKILSIIEAVDQPPVKEEPEIVLLRYSNADAIAKILNKSIGRERMGTIIPGQPAVAIAEKAKAVPDHRLNAVILLGDKGMQGSMKELISLLDIPSPEAQRRINVYFLENADATELSKTLQRMLKGVQPPMGPVAPGAPGAPAPFEVTTDITITPDKTTNSLIIAASPADHQNLLQVIKQLDKRRRQVFVEAMITEVSIDNLLELGARWRGAVTKDKEPIFVGGFGRVDPTTIQSIITGLTGLTMGGVGHYLTIPKDFIPRATADVIVPGLAAIFSLDEFKGVINVLSTPQILTSDLKEAEIIVGENVPIITRREADPTRPGVLFHAIERRDVGVRLKITPQITEGDYVKLDVYQEISSVKAEPVEVVISVGPTLTKRSTNTSVVAKDGQTVVIGGLMQEKKKEDLRKVPLLGDIPLLGQLFRYRSVEERKTNLLVFLTPHIVREADQLSRLTEEKQIDFARAKNKYKQGELLIKFKEDTSVERISEILSMKGAAIIELKPKGLHHIRLKEGQEVKEAIEIFRKHKEVDYAKPNYIWRIRGTK